MAGETPSTSGPPAEGFAPHGQSITFGLDNHAVFFNALLGLVKDGQVRMVQVATWRDDWKSIHEPRRALLLSVVKREDMGVAGLVIEAAPGYAFLTPCTPAGMALPDAVSVIVPSTRIARIHLPRRGEYWQASDPEQQAMQQEPSGASPAADPTVPKPRAPRPNSLIRIWWDNWRRARTPTATSLPPPPDPEGVPTLADWINTLPQTLVESAPEPTTEPVSELPAAEPAPASGGWVVPDDSEEDAGSGHSQVA